MRVDRQRCRYYWNLFDLYKALGLCTYSKQPSKWVWDCSERWMKLFFAAGLRPDTFIASTATRGLSHLLFQDRCLPTPATSTTGLLVLLATWSLDSAKRGGLRAQGPRHAASDLLRAFVTLASCAKAWEISVVFDAEWKPVFPLEDERAPDMQLPVSTDGDVDLAMFIDQHNFLLLASQA